MDTMTSQITSLMIVYSTVYSGADQRKHQSSVSLAFVRVIHRWPHKGPITRKMFPFYDVIMYIDDQQILLDPWNEHRSWCIPVMNSEAYIYAGQTTGCVTACMLLATKQRPKLRFTASVASPLAFWGLTMDTYDIYASRRHMASWMLIMIDSGNALSPAQHQTITWTSSGELGTNFGEIWSKWNNFNCRECNSKCRNESVGQFVAFTSRRNFHGVYSSWLRKSRNHETFESRSFVMPEHIMPMGGGFKYSYVFLNLRALKCSPVNEIHIFERYPLKFHTKYLKRYDPALKLKFGAKP